MEISNHDISVLRTLAEKYMGYASLPVQDEKRERWLSLNHLAMQKPMVMVDQMPWHELDVDGSLVCQMTNPCWRGVENWMRQEIYKWEHLPADMVLNPYILIPRPIENSGYGISIEVDHAVTDPNNAVVAHKFHNVFQTYEDIEKIKTPRIVLNTEAQKDISETADRIFEGVAPYRMAGIIMHLGIWDLITQCMGVENCYIELMDRPEFMHALMERLTQAYIAQIEQINAFGGFDVNTNLCHCAHTFSDDLPSPDCDLQNPASKDVWAFGLAQLFSSVSPAITDEFEVPYMQRLFPYFGAIYYGCCDRLDDRLDIVDKMPNIRKISCSPWSDRENFAANLPTKYIMSNKPNPALLAGDTFDEEVVRADIRRTIAAAKAHNINLELILKDISTVRYDPKRLWRWAEIAMEETSR